MGSIMLMIVCVTMAVAGFASRVQADYHVSDVLFYDINEAFVACPSNYYNCGCFRFRQRRGTLSQQPPELSAFFTITNFCGYKQLNHYLNSDGTYSVYVNGSDGILAATYYGADTRRATFICPIQHAVTDIVYDYLLYYGQPCNPSTGTGSTGLDTNIE